MIDSRRVLRITFAVLLLAGGLFASLCGCGKSEEPIYVDLSKREDIGYQEDRNTITYAYLPQYTHRVSYERHHPLVEYLKRETGLPIRQIFPDTFDDFIKLVGQQKVDICFSNPFTYIKVANKYGVKAFARIIEIDGNENFRGQIIARADSKSIQTIADCKGKRWIAVDASSAGGYLYALGYFFDHGITRKDFAEIAFAPGPGGQQEKVVLAVLAGRYDLGSIREGTLDIVADKIDLSQIKVLGYTPWYPGWMFAARADLSPNIVSIIKRALLKLDCSKPDQRSICDAARTSGIISAVDSDFDPVRELAAKVEIDLNQ